MQQPESSLWPAGTTAEVAARWILEAPMTDLPSESLKTKQALLAKQGNPKWSSVAMGRQQSTVDAKKKLSFWRQPTEISSIKAPEMES